jgi:hypothetical protein
VVEIRTGFASPFIEFPGRVGLGPPSDSPQLLEFVTYLEESDGGLKPALNVCAGSLVDPEFLLTA